eukprot:169650-Amphidinium_carterae.1
MGPSFQKWLRQFPPDVKPLFGDKAVPPPPPQEFPRTKRKKNPNDQKHRQNLIFVCVVLELWGGGGGTIFVPAYAKMHATIPALSNASKYFKDVTVSVLMLLSMIINMNH